MSIVERLSLATYNAATWQNVHYGLAALATLVLIVRFAIKGSFDLGFAGFVTGMWTTAVGNDLVNTPPKKQ